MSDDPFYTQLTYVGRGGERVTLRHTPGAKSPMTRCWWWRHPGGKWHGPIERMAHMDNGRVDDAGKREALLAAAHAFGKSGASIEWTPEPSTAFRWQNRGE